MKKDDLLWKAIIEEVFWDFLLFFYPDYIHLVDTNQKPEFLDTEFDKLFESADKDGVKHVDKLVKLKLKDGTERYILLHIEVQSQRRYDEDLAKRMFRYMTVIWNKHHSIDITALAVLADPVKSYLPSAYEKNVWGNKLLYEFSHYKIINQDEQKLRADPNPFAVVVLTALLALKKKKMDDNQLLQMKHELYDQMNARQMSKSKRKGILNFIKYNVQFEDKNFFTIFDTQVKEKEGRSTTMGTEEYLLQKATNEGKEIGKEIGIEIGEEKKSHTVVANLLNAGKFTVSEIANFASVTEEYVLKVQAELKKKKKK